MELLTKVATPYYLYDYELINKYLNSFFDLLHLSISLLLYKIKIISPIIIICIRAIKKVTIYMLPSLCINIPEKLKS